MNYLIAGLAKSGTTILFSRLREALPDPVLTYFEPDQDQQLADILAAGAVDTTLTKVLIGRVTADNALLRDFERHVLIYRDPRDQFISMLLYLFYDFQLSGDSGGFRQARDALQDKVNDPERYSTIELYNTVAGLVGRAPIGVFNNLHREQQAYIERFSPHLLRYEDFIDGKLGGVEGYLSLSLKNKAEVADSYTRVARSRAYGDWKNWLNQEDQDYLQGEWGSTLQRLGYPLVPQLENGPCISRSTSLDYVDQFDPSARQG
jgi:hypothetical protein